MVEGIACQGYNLMLWGRGWPLTDGFHHSRGDLNSTVHTNVEVPDGSSCDMITSLVAFFNSVRFYTMWVSIIYYPFLCLSIYLTSSRDIQGRADVQITTGDGPEWATLQQVIQTLLEDQSSWLTTQDGSGWARPAFTPVLLSKHKTHWKTTGMFILLHLLTLGNGPEPKTPPCHALSGCIGSSSIQ